MAVRTAPRTQAPAFSIIDGGPIRSIFLALVPALALAVFWRVWQGYFGFSYGLDASVPGFASHWMPIFAFNMVGLPLIAGGWYAWLVWTGLPMARQELDRAEEARRIWRLWLHIVAVAMAAYLGASFFAEEDAAWHQVTMRDTAFTPSHIALFYGSFPVLLYTAFGAFLYARTRLPHLYGGKGIPIAFALVIGGSFLLIFQVAFNEFGHTFWQTEEVFAAPLHWPFVFFAYMVFAIFSVWLVSARRLAALVKEEDPESDKALLHPLARRWDLSLILMFVLLLMAGTHVAAMLFAGDWSFWVDWKDRQWWPLITPAVNIVFPAAIQYVAWTKFRLPLGATLCAVALLLAQWLSRVISFDLWANLPLNLVWPETMILTAIIMDVVLLLSRSFVITSVVGSFFWGALFWASNWPALAPFLQPIVQDGQALTVADVLAAEMPRSQGPEYLRVVEEGHLRALVGNVTIIVSFFAAMVCAVVYWFGIAVGKFIGIWPGDRSFQFQTDSES